MTTLAENAREVREAFAAFGNAVRVSGISVFEMESALKTLSGACFKKKEERSIAVFIPKGKVRKIWL
jgi:hypothetical protein